MIVELIFKLFENTIIIAFVAFKAIICWLFSLAIVWYIIFAFILLYLIGKIVSKLKGK